MKKILIKIFSINTILLFFITCFFCLNFTISFAEARSIVDQIGQKVDLPKEPVRVISLAPGITEMLYSLGANNKLVAATRYSNFPEAAKELPRIGSYIQLDLERIVALKPDICLATKDGNPRRTVDAIMNLGIPVFAINPRSIDQIMDAFILLGDLLGTSNRAVELVDDLNNRIDIVKRKISKTQSRPTAFFQISDMPIVSSGANSFIDKLITLAGGTNLAGTMKGYPRFSWENIMMLQPEIVLISSMSGGKSEKLLKDTWQQWPEIPAVKNNRLHVVDADLFNRPTARLIAGLEILAEILHPELSGERGVK